MSTPTGIFIAYGALLTMAVIPIYAGSLTSLRSLKRPAGVPKSRTKILSPLDDSDSDSESAASESLSSSDAYMFPVFGSGVLFGLYLLFRFLNKDYINMLLTAYFCVLGIAALAKAGVDITRKIMPVRLLKGVEKYKILLTKEGKQLYTSSFTLVHGILLLASILLTGYYALTKNWIASNMFGLSFSVNAIQLLSLDSFKTGMILLSGLFFYDVFWVFGTEVMVSVAKNFDAPIKVVWPKDVIAWLLGSAEKVQFTMLGLGDIVIPGIFVALCLRFDHHQAWKRSSAGRDYRSSDFPKPYFTSCLVAYVSGLVTTIVIMHTFQAAQPALLYLSPACILSALGTALVRGELKELFAYSTEEDDKEPKEVKEKKDTKKAKKEEKKKVEEVKKEEEKNEEEEGAEADVEEEDYVAVDPEEPKGSAAAASPKTGAKKRKGKRAGGKA
ncbi:signal peptide peptidase-domain-containing protein [Jimgerdemannia flammicorona]|uniref:Signal peptide peptidase-domain-containing protein n=2 Tax=Jimgerdemannia flammicorona TaxID=994334 RepID=A0A433QDR1_9FUNG|nr:signal peptide peptidase-domain-containing protein [Jimgerdemannia flammicorona]RUS27918.1 signal peptide peptidase-domain-containing protein [Jimgerdemannia flammicorona]